MAHSSITLWTLKLTEYLRLRKLNSIHFTEFLSFVMSCTCSYPIHNPCHSTSQSSVFYSTPIKLLFSLGLLPQALLVVLLYLAYQCISVHIMQSQSTLSGIPGSCRIALWFLTLVQTARA